MEAEGILNGSTINDLKINTIKKMGKKDRAYSTIRGSVAAVDSPITCDGIPRRFGARSQVSTAQMAPLTTVNINNNAEKSKFIKSIGRC